MCNVAIESSSIDSDGNSTIIGDEPTLTEFDPVYEHPEEDQEIKPRENLEIILSDPIQLKKKRSSPDT